MSEPTAPPDARQFRNTIGMFATGVAIILARAGEETLAMTANAVSSVSLDPMLVMFCPSKRSNLARHLSGLSAFSINILRHDQESLSTYFAGGWKAAQPPPFRLIPSTHAPRLEGALATIECQTWKTLDVGDHFMVLGQVMRLHTGIQPHHPLVFQSGRYRHLQPGESSPAPDLSDVKDEPAHVYYE